ncbi:MAG TPA: caspase family protein [Phycisphaerales bacterium]|nr:caspase family protein [Phycisphaerales bacterium]
MARYAVCIGINDYPGTGSDLSGCVNDAKDWRAALQARGFKVLPSLLNSDATGKNMREAMQHVVSMAKGGDTVVVQYSGHGSYVDDVDGDEDDGHDECLCPYDIDTKGEITDDELFQIFNAKASGARVVFLSDSCHSGTVAKFAPSFSRSAAKVDRRVKFLPPQTFLSKQRLANMGGVNAGFRMGKAPGRYAALLMSGCMDYEYSYDAVINGRPNGAFTYAAVKCLAALTKSATFAQWHRAVRTMLPSQSYPQSPNLYGPSNWKKWKVFA